MLVNPLFAVFYLEINNMFRSLVISSKLYMKSGEKSILSGKRLAVFPSVPQKVTLGKDEVWSTIWNKPKPAKNPLKKWVLKNWKPMVPFLYNIRKNYSFNNAQK